MIGQVALVGAGPGDPGLLTLKAKRLIEEADIIVYDYLANVEHLRHAQKDCVKIGVGRGFRHKRLTQKKINLYIIAQAKKGKKVVRLKGGDPYLFGRGGEEALQLLAHKIPFEVVPGVTSGTACAAYAGVPLTHRDHNSSVTFLTGHKANDKNLDSIDWEKIVSIGGTLVIYMGFYNLATIAKKLMSSGMPAQTPACVVQWGTLPWQKSAAGPISRIAALSLKKGLGAPSIIIIGNVVSFKDSLDWYEKLPFFGKTIVVTRMKEKSVLLSGQLSSLGAEILEFPTIEIKPPASFKMLDEAIKKIKNYDWLFFTSAYGVTHFFDRLRSFHRLDARTFHGVRVACIGPETERTLETYGVRADFCPKHFESSALLPGLQKTFGSLRGKKVLLVRTDIAPFLLDKELKKAGAVATRLIAYRTRIPRKISSTSKKNLFSKKMDCVTFTSASTVNNFISILGLQKVRKLAKTTKFASIGPVTSEALKRNGLKAYCQAKVYTISGLIQAMKGKI